MSKTVYTREQGVHCVEVPIRRKGIRRSLASELLEADLAWCWESWRDGTPSEQAKTLNLPAYRSLTILTAASADQLLDDFTEENIDGDGRSILLYGMDKGDERPIQRVALLERVAEFARSATGSIRIVVSQLSDSSTAHFFVPASPDPAVQRILERWGPALDGGVVHKPYSRLGVAKLEELIKPNVPQ